MDKLSRRKFLIATTAAGAAATLIPESPLAAAPASSTAANTTPTQYRFLQRNEVQFLEAACERLIPRDEAGPGALDAAVPNYFDQQLGGAWGAGERLYRTGPWFEGEETQGYQLPYVPAELFRIGVKAIDAELAKQNKSFAAMSVEEQENYLRDLEKSTRDLNGVSAKIFFRLVSTMTVEGYFADPLYGGNKDMCTWRMLGFPGAYADYYDLIDQHGIKLQREPMSIAQANASSRDMAATHEMPSASHSH